MRFLVNLGIGLVFGAGLVVSGMSDPAKVLNFLDVTGQWDASLVLVLGGAVVVTFVGYRLAWSRGAPLTGGSFQLPQRTDIDARLIVGPVIFGVGWGIAGLCPGPALTSLSLAEPGVLVFVPAMFVGMWIARILAGHVSARSANTAGPAGKS